MANNENKTTAKMPKPLLAKSNALDWNLTNVDNNIIAEINKVKLSLENFKALQKRSNYDQENS